MDVSEEEVRAAEAVAGWRRHWDAHGPPAAAFAAEAREFVQRLRGVLPVSEEARILDFGCGFGFVARELAADAGANVLAWDVSATMRGYAAELLAPLPRARCLDALSPATLAEHGPFDRVIVNSVLQYMTPADAARWVPALGTALAPDGVLVLSDLIPPSHGFAREVVRLGLTRPDLLRGRMRDWARSYVGRLQRFPLQRVAAASVEAWAARADLRCEWLAESLTHLPARRAALLRR